MVISICGLQQGVAFEVLNQDYAVRDSMLLLILVSFHFVYRIDMSSTWVRLITCLWVSSHTGFWEIHLNEINEVLFYYLPQYVLFPE
jgi:hypothetical protein